MKGSLVAGESRILLLFFSPFVFECRGSLSHLQLPSEAICRLCLLAMADLVCGVFFNELLCGFYHYLISLPHNE